ncbi:MAG: hypothetical protein O7J95_10510 [Planctomycetota bacterium]|nr:hypothetical protein [Planctomycetota bacterium]
MKSSPAVTFLLLAASWGCSAPAERLDQDRTLPFSVLLREIDPPAQSPDEMGDASTPALFVDVGSLTRRLARSLEENGIFTRVLLEGESDVTPDLELEITVNDYDFGPGRPTTRGAFLSTLAWMFGGPLSWFIDNREYPESRVSLLVVLRDGLPPGAGSEAASREAPEIFRDVLFLDGMQLSFLERADMSDWLWNILIPPWCGDGDPVEAGKSLVKRTETFFIDNESPRILSFFPADYVRRTFCFLGHDSRTEDLVIVSQQPVDGLTIRSERGEHRVLDQDEMPRLEVAESDKETLRRWFRERVVGLGSDPSDRYYRVPLEPWERGFVRIEALLEGGVAPTRWTIHRSEPGGIPEDSLGSAPSLRVGYRPSGSRRSGRSSPRGWADPHRGRGSSAR